MKETLVSYSRLGWAGLIVDYRGVGASGGARVPEHLAMDAEVVWEEALQRRRAGELLVLRGVSLGSLPVAGLLARGVGADGVAFTAGGPTVKNVTGYDLCRLLVGSLGTLALVGRVILRTHPVPARSLWLAGEAEPERVLDATYRPSCVLWDGVRTSVLLEGHGEDVDGTAGRLALLGLTATEPPVLPPGRGRWTGRLSSGGVLEVGSGVVHQPDDGGPPTVSDGVRRLAGRMRASFDPSGRLNPGRDPYRVAA
jgi:glycolate oxidase FAD binding subunit